MPAVLPPRRDVRRPDRRPCRCDNPRGLHRVDERPDDHPAGWHRRGAVVRGRRGAPKCRRVRCLSRNPTGEGGPVPPTGKSAEADYVYVMDFDGDKIRHMTKIWNDGLTMRQLGWAT